MPYLVIAGVAFIAGGITGGAAAGGIQKAVGLAALGAGAYYMMKRRA